jgi:hypothetical protein
MPKRASAGQAVLPNRAKAAALLGQKLLYPYKSCCCTWKKLLLPHSLMSLHRLHEDGKYRVSAMRKKVSLAHDLGY